MKIHEDTQKLIVWLGKRLSATTVQIAASGVMKSRDATRAFEYGLRHGVFEAVGRSQKGSQYRLTGRQLLPGDAVRASSVRSSGASFDGLLDAWGIARTPPLLAAKLSVRSLHY